MTNMLIDFLVFRPLDLFKTVFPYRHGINRLIMDTEKVHSIKQCHVDVTNYANPLNCCCEGPEDSNCRALPPDCFWNDGVRNS